MRSTGAGSLWLAHHESEATPMQPIHLPQVTCPDLLADLGFPVPFQSQGGVTAATPNHIRAPALSEIDPDLPDK